MPTRTRITQRGITWYTERHVRHAAGIQSDALKAPHDDIYPANPQDPMGWPKWRRVVTNMRDGFVVIYTEHEPVHV